MQSSGQEKIFQTEAQMMDFGQEFSSTLRGGDIVTLHGELGAGKTTLTKGILQGMGVKEILGSPTFTLMNVYGVPAPKNEISTVIHIDAYRTESEAEFLDIGIEDYLGKEDTVCIIEWPEKISGLLKNKKITPLYLTHIPEGRKVSF